MTKSIDHLYSDGAVYNLLADERGSFYKDIHGITRLIAFLELPEGILEVGSGWDRRGQSLIQHEVPEVPYFTDADNFVDLTAPDAMLAGHDRKYSCVLGVCYTLNALCRADYQHPEFSDLVVALKNIRSVLTDNGFALFGVYPSSKVEDCCFTSDITDYPNPRLIERVTGKKSVSDSPELKYTVTQSRVGNNFSIAWSNVVADGLNIEIKRPLFTKYWEPDELQEAATLAGFSHTEMYAAHIREDNGYSLATIDTVFDGDVSHVLFYA